MSIFSPFIPNNPRGILVTDYIDHFESKPEGRGHISGGKSVRRRSPPALLKAPPEPVEEASRGTSLRSTGRAVLDLNGILKIALKGGASDIHLKPGLPPMFRVEKTVTF
jgi:hypothetical protein